jgi:hypothetical protein
MCGISGIHVDIYILQNIARWLIYLPSTIAVVVSVDVSFDNSVFVKPCLQPRRKFFCWLTITAVQQPPNQDFLNADLFAHSVVLDQQPLLLKKKPSTSAVDPDTFEVFTHPDIDELYDPNVVIPTSDCDQFDAPSRASIVHDAQHQHLSKNSPILMMLIGL